MELVKQFLQKFSHLNLPDDTLKRLFIDLVDTDLNLKISKQQLSVRRGVLVVDASPTIKSEIYLNKTKILTKLKTGLGPKAPTDIR